MIGARVC